MNPVEALPKSVGPASEADYSEPVQSTAGTSLTVRILLDQGTPPLESLPLWTRMEVERLRFYVDPDTLEPHILRHGVTEEEVQEVLSDPIEDRWGARAARVVVGRTRTGRFLRVIYVADPTPRSFFVITAYPLGPKALWALRRRQRRKP